jgi:DNA (cytosine-5)-methyltransferase 1
MIAWYNEIDPYCAQWLRNLISCGFIAGGDVDERDIRDVRPADLKSYGQCHFFAGIGGWSHALRLGSVPDHRKVWTGSCPCQPFSVAGARRGFADERHLWPYWFHLVGQCRPDTIFGEQVASKAGLAWLDLVHADLEAAGYAVAGADLCAAGVGAPHIRQRLWFVAHAGRERGAGRRDICDVGSKTAGDKEESQERQRVWNASDNCGSVGVVADRAVTRWRLSQRSDEAHRWPASQSGRLCDVGELVQPNGTGSFTGHETAKAVGHGSSAVAADRGPWSDPEWLPCIDGKARPTKPGLFPLAHGLPGRVAQLRALGNAIVPQVAAEFIRAALAGA